MRNKIIALLLPWFLLSLIFSQPTPLIETKWGQSGDFARFTPDNWRLGCWSTAFAQIMYYHRLVPTGQESYETSTGYSISEDFDSYTFDFSLFVNEFDRNTPEESIDEVAMYGYFSSVVVRKDYGTGTYVRKPNGTDGEYEEHYGCEASPFYSTSNNTFEELEAIVTEEIDNRNPIFLYMTSSDGGHAVVIDGYYIDNGNFMVHCNMGWEGRSDTWYDFDGDISGYQVSRIMTIHNPSVNNHPDTPQKIKTTSIASNKVYQNLNNTVTVRYHVSQQSTVTIAIYTPEGRLVKSLHNHIMPSGSYAIEWDVKNDADTPVSCGLYIVRITIPGNMVAKTVVVSK